MPSNEEMLAACCEAAGWRFSAGDWWELEGELESAHSFLLRRPLERRDDAHALYLALAGKLGDGYRIRVALTAGSGFYGTSRDIRILELSPADFVKAMYESLGASARSARLLCWPLVGDTWQRGLTERHVTEVSESTVTCEVWNLKTGLRRGVAVVAKNQFARWAATATLIRRGWK